MADKITASPSDQGALRRFRDMGDGTWAEVFSLSPGAAGAAAFPAGAVPVASQAAGANSSAAATLAAAVGKRTYVTGIQVTAGGATANILAGAVLSGVLGGSIGYVVSVPAGVGLDTRPIIVSFSPPLPASADNTAIVLTLGALGAGNTSSSVAIQGFQL